MRHLLLFAIALLSLISYGQRKTDANIVGDVKDSKTGEHIPFINVTINNTVIGTSTDATGHYFLKNLPTGTFTMRINGIGYKTVEKDVVLEPGKTIEVNFLTEETSLSLNEVVVSANRNETNCREASVVVGVVSPKIFAATNSVCIADGLNFQPGLRVENNCNNCGFTQIRINGLEGPYSQILIDSRPIFSALSGVYGLEQIPVNMIERVEVVRGGGSALYGSNAIAGTINIITKEALNNSFTAGYNYERIGGTTSDNAVNLNTSMVSDDNKAGMYLYGSYRNRLPYDHNGDTFSEVTRLLNHTTGMRSYYHLSSQSKLTLEYHNIHEFRRGGNDFHLQPHQTDITEQVEHETNGGGLAYNWFSPDAKQKLNVYTSLQQVLRQSYYGAGQNPDAYGSTNNLTSVTGAQYVYNFNNSLFMPSELTVGSEYQYDDLHDRMPGYGRDIKQTTRVAGFFLQNEWKNKDMNILLGGRLDKHNLLEKAVFSPRITLKYNFTPNLNWRGSYAAGFRAPQAFEEDLHVDAAGGVMKLIELSDNLRPEYSHSFSTSLDYYFKLGNTEVNLLAEGFHTRINDLFILTETGMSPNGHIIVERQNGSGGQVSGINFEGKIAPSTRLQLQFGYTLQQSLYNEPEQWSDDINVAPERRMLRTPNNYGYFSLSANLTRKLLINATGTYTGSMLAPHFAGYIATDRLETTPQFMDVNLKTTYDFKLNGINLQLSGGVKNIFNSYQKDLDIGPLRDAGYVYGPSIPRTVFVSLKFSNLTF
ncbi:MAG: TonB-dependent receptor [Paludibacter sp.]|nr:TonB-dependent receptor [Paludibacter sp.]MDD4427193.1 TonB-dependent receptor [Paludibacter sp.]